MTLDEALSKIRKLFEIKYRGEIKLHTDGNKFEVFLSGQKLSAEDKIVAVIV